MTAEEQILESLRHSEKRYHLFKAILIMLCTVGLGIFMVYEGNKSVDHVNAKNQRVESLLRCSLPAFTPSNYPTADRIINKCLKDNR